MNCIKRLLKNLINRKVSLIMVKEKDKIQRLPIFETCKDCDGTGRMSSSGQVVNGLTIYPKSQFDYLKTCETCKGSGKKKTNFFLEVPKEIPKLKEWWL